MSSKKLLITFDYELFLGKRSGRPSACMLEPTRKLMEILSRYRVRGIFFVDTTYLLRLKELAASDARCAEDLAQVLAQLNELVREGHEVFPHIHPHWLDARYHPNTRQWDLSNVKRYRFHALSPADREAVFTGSVKLLREAITPNHPAYRLDGYRAGGWCIQPFADFKPLFESCGIAYEFSVLRGMYQFTDAQYFDFSMHGAPMSYRFSEDVCVPDPNGPFTEFTIDLVRVPSLIKTLNRGWLRFIYSFRGDHTFDRGAGQPSRSIAGVRPVSAAGCELGTDDRERISVETLTAVKLNMYLNHLESAECMHFLSHPKMVNQHSLTTFDRFLDKAASRYTLETDFRKMS